MDNDNNWLFDSSKILSSNNVSIIFEYYDNGINYDLLYSINRKVQENRIIASSLFSGFIDFENDSDVKEEYQLSTLNNIVNITYNQLIGNYINTSGIFITPKDGTYNLSILISYKYEANVENLFYDDNKPYYSLNSQNGELAKKIIPYINYNTSPNHSYSLITNGNIEINVVSNLEVNESIFLIYHNNNNQLNINYTNCYFNIYIL